MYIYTLYIYVYIYTCMQTYTQHDHLLFVLSYLGLTCKFLILWSQIRDVHVYIGRHAGMIAFNTLKAKCAIPDDIA